MRAALSCGIAALRGFARGFLGLAASKPCDAKAARERLRETAARRSHCC